jgi:CRAL/TRIO domain
MLTRDQIIGSPSFFPTVWGWIKRWFDPVTVNKIFILSHHETKARLSEFIDPDDFPKRYGGNLDWDFGMVPNLDDAAREAVEKNGSKGWITGPCLWEHDQRVPVGTVNGKPRRPADLEPQPHPPPEEAEEIRTEGPAEVANGLPRPTEPEPKQLPQQSSEPTQPQPPSHLQPTAPSETSSPPSMAHSGSNASTFVGTPPESTINAAQAATDGTARVMDSEAPIVANGHVLRVGDVKPPMERFVTAVEDLAFTKNRREEVGGVA